MVERAKIRAFCDAIVRQFHPKKIILFGSYAYGQPTEDSDVDLLVIMPHDRRKGRMSLKILEAVDYDFPLDLLVRSPAEVARRLRWNDCFMAEVISKGQIMYEVHHA
jgi:predicted nucleotidyltransferase